MQARESIDDRRNSINISLPPEAIQLIEELRRSNAELRQRVDNLKQTPAGDDAPSNDEISELRARNGDLERLTGELKALNNELRRANTRTPPSAGPHRI